MKSSANLLPPFGYRRCLTTASGSGSNSNSVEPRQACWGSPLHPEVDYVFVAAAAIFCVYMCVCVWMFFLVFCLTKQTKNFTFFTDAWYRYLAWHAMTAVCCGKVASLRDRDRAGAEAVKFLFNPNKPVASWAKQDLCLFIKFVFLLQCCCCCCCGRLCQRPSPSGMQTLSHCIDTKQQHRTT